MPTIAQLAEQSIDWYAELGLVGRARESAELDLFRADQATMAPGRLRPGDFEQRGNDPGSFTSGRPQASVRPPRLNMTDRIMNEVHSLLCGGEAYNEERTKFAEQYRLGQTGFAAAVTTTLIPALGQAAPIVGVGVALTLTSMGKVGLNAWCAERTQWKASYEGKLKRYEEGLTAYRRAMEQAPPGARRMRPGSHRRLGE